MGTRPLPWRFQESTLDLVRMCLRGSDSHNAARGIDTIQHLYVAKSIKHIYIYIIVYLFSNRQCGTTYQTSGRRENPVNLQPDIDTPGSLLYPS